MIRMNKIIKEKTAMITRTFLNTRKFWTATTKLEKSFTDVSMFGTELEESRMNKLNKGKIQTVIDYMRMILSTVKN